MALRKVVEKEHGDVLGSSIATQPDLDTTTVLNIAYQTSLRNTLQRRFVDKQKWFLASRRLEEQDRMVSEKEQVTAAAQKSRKQLEGKDKDITSVWEKNWIGDQSVYKLLLPEGSSPSEQELWSNASFHRLLQTGSFGKLGPISSNSTILLEMEDALKVHEDRLSQRSEFSDRFLKERSGSKRLLSGKKVSFAADVGGGLGVDFNKHQVRRFVTSVQGSLLATNLF
ncbi:hypothetical protein ABW20_dc0100073 [Dactylellina cionopaga]|nr:hypothetical protein ABW20_dc0100073 [Dactylellina cionopaga]